MNKFSLRVRKLGLSQFLVLIWTLASIGEHFDNVCDLHFSFLLLSQIFASSITKKYALSLNKGIQTRFMLKRPLRTITLFRDKILEAKRKRENGTSDSKFLSYCKIQRQFDNISSARHFCRKIQPLFFHLKKSAIFRVFRDFSLKIFLAYFKKSMFFHDIRDRRTIWERKLHVKC